MTRKDQIKNAYKVTGNSANFYDGMITYSTLPGKAVCRIVWKECIQKQKSALLRAWPAFAA